MKKIALVLAICSTLGGNALLAAPSSKLPPCKGNNEFAWGTCISSLAIISIVAGLTAGCASGESSKHK